MSSRRRIELYGHVLALAFCVLLVGGQCAAQPLVWSSLPAIPDDHGFAGPVAGTSGGALLVAGGANFPDAKPWEGGTKRWYDTIRVLDTPTATWRTVGRLPRPLGYAVSITTPRGIACLGGSDANRHYADCFLLRYAGQSLHVDPLPELPRAVANACGALVGQTIYLAGGLSTPADTEALNVFWSLDLDHLEDGWQSLASWPGEPRMLATAAAHEGAFYLLSGVSLSADVAGRPQRKYLSDAYRYAPKVGWTRIADLPEPRVAAPTPAPPLGPAHLLLLGGDEGRQLSAAPEEHRGFARQALKYDTRTNRWTPAGELPVSLVTTTAVLWNDAIVIPGGEERPGIRSTEVAVARVVARKAHFGWLNYLTLVTYLGGMVAIGWWFAARNKNTDDYFKAGGRIPWWAAGLSIYATMLSSLTFMAIPAKAFTTDWTYFWANLPILLLAPLVIRYYLPFFRQLDVTSAYEYLERRFNLAVRWYGSAAFILFQLGRQAIVLLLPALALATVSDLNVEVCIVLMGAMCVAYTVMGGIEAVIWTDVVQSLVLLGSALLSLGIILWQVGGSPAELLEPAWQQGKLRLFNWTLDPSTSANAFWVILIGNLFITLVPYTSDQAVVQRYLTTSSQHQAARAIWTNGLLSIPSTALFFAIGTALFVFYERFPEQIDPAQASDAVFPAFIVANLPVGIAGLAIAGIFAAAQSTVSSSLNSVVTALMTDFYTRLRPVAASRRGDLRLARLLTAAIGILATLAALALAASEAKSLWDAYNGLVGLAGSGLAGLFALGIFTRRATAPGALLGAVSSAVVLYFVQQHTTLHFFLYALVGISSCVVVGYLASLALPARQHSLAGLTIHDLRREPDDRRTPEPKNRES